MRTVFTTFITLLAFTSTAYAQTGPCPATNPGFVANPTHGCFRANVTEHNEVDIITGAQKITRYDLQFFAETVDPTNPANNPIQTSPLGKPAITDNTSGTIWFGTGTPTPLPSYPIAQRLKSVIVAVGPGGSSPRGAAAVSNPFGRSNPQTAPSAPSGHFLMPE